MLKFRKNSVFDSLFLSDIHYLIDKKKTAHNQLFSTLNYFHKRNIFFREIILVGDIIENWYFNASRKIKKRKKKINKLFDLLERIVVNNGRQIYLIGNHDTTSYDLTLPQEISSFLKQRKWQILEIYETASMIVFHGHQGQYGRIRWRITIILLRILYRIPLLWTFLEFIYSRFLDFDKNLSDHAMTGFYDRLSRQQHQGNRVMVLGHTHHFTCIPENRVINTGDWIYSKSLVIREKRSYYGFRVLKAKKKKALLHQEFEYHHNEVL